MNGDITRALLSILPIPRARNLSFRIRRIRWTPSSFATSVREVKGVIFYFRRFCQRFHFEYDTRGARTQTTPSMDDKVQRDERMRGVSKIQFSYVSATSFFFSHHRQRFSECFAVLLSTRYLPCFDRGF